MFFAFERSAGIANLRFRALVDFLTGRKEGSARVPRNAPSQSRSESFLIHYFSVLYLTPDRPLHGAATRSRFNMLFY